MGTSGSSRRTRGLQVSLRGITIIQGHSGSGSRRSCSILPSIASHQHKASGSVLVPSCGHLQSQRRAAQPRLLFSILIRFMCETSRDYAMLLCWHNLDKSGTRLWCSLFGSFYMPEDLSAMCRSLGMMLDRIVPWTSRGGEGVVIPKHVDGFPRHSSTSLSLLSPCFATPQRPSIPCSPTTMCPRTIDA